MRGRILHPLLRRLCPRRGPFARRSIRRAARAGQCGHPAVFSRRIRRGLPQKLGRLARIAGVASPNASDSEAAEAFIRWIRKTNAKMGIPETIPQIRSVDIPEMAHHAAKESNPLYPVPVLMDEGRLAQMYLELMPAKEENA
ncbi:MAG: iron-containing alcohol dehydrogenase [Christensenellales bacterium]